MFLQFFLTFCMVLYGFQFLFFVFSYVDDFAGLGGDQELAAIKMRNIHFQPT